jgi:hypothetical protein
VHNKFLGSAYIMIEYGGTMDKPIPSNVFYIDSFNKGNYFFGSTYKVSKSSFQGIADAIRRSVHSVKTDISLVGYCNFFIATENESVLYVTNDFHNTSQLFKEISRQVLEDGIRNSLEGSFTDILSRIK